MRSSTQRAASSALAQWLDARVMFFHYGTGITRRWQRGVAGLGELSGSVQRNSANAVTHRRNTFDFDERLGPDSVTGGKRTRLGDLSVHVLLPPI